MLDFRVLRSVRSGIVLASLSWQVAHSAPRLESHISAKVMYRLCEDSGHIRLVFCPLETTPHTHPADIAL